MRTLPLRQAHRTLNFSLTAQKAPLSGPSAFLTHVNTARFLDGDQPADYRMGMYTHLTGLLFIAPEGHTNFSGISLSVSGLSFT